MALVVTLSGVLGLTGALVGYALASVVYLASPARAQNRLLALCLVLEATYWGAAVGLSGFTDAKEHAYLAFALHTYAVGAYAGIYMLFLGTLPTPLARPFRGTTGLLIAGGTIASVWIGFTLAPELFIRDIVLRGGGPSYIYLEGPATLGFLGFSVVAVLYSVAVAVSAYRRAPVGTAARQRAKLLAIAFGVRDVLLAFYLVVFRLLHLQAGSQQWQWADHIFGAAVPIVGMALLSYGILHSQVLDIDLHVKRGMARTTVAGAFAVAFFLGSELLEDVIPVDGTLLGLLAAGAVALALRPLHAAATRLSDRIMPGVGAGAAYLRDRTGEVYRAAYESALESGGVSEKERATLDRLAAKLGLSLDVARALEAETERRLLRITPASGAAPA
ncbi:MAG TPA: hypothetical protein VM582_02515 [Candidatus Thermoplasmatota archaeon]|nr:hypothetical protein [Candidatus Thermoplasmatota archaeon]